MISIFKIYSEKCGIVLNFCCQSFDKLHKYEFCILFTLHSYIKFHFEIKSVDVSYILCTHKKIQ